MCFEGASFLKEHLMKQYDMLVVCLSFQSATLLSGQEQPEKKASDSDDSSSDEEADRRLDLSTTTM